VTDPAGTGPVLVEEAADRVVLLTLNRPEVHNALDTATERLLHGHLDRIEEDPGVRCVVLTGAGDTAFSAGYDIHELSALSADEVTLALLQRERWMWRFATFPRPTIAAVGGVAHGAGALYSFGADLRIGAEHTNFRVTAGRYGGANATWNLPLLVGMGKAKEILYTSRRVEAGEAERIGLLNAVVPAARLRDEALTMASLIAANPPEGIAECKGLIHDGPGRSLQHRFEAENVVMRTTLNPKPMTELFSGFLSTRSDRNGGPTAHSDIERPL
jgi:2-(1,2-epoxy-1,2-dihydrophenyl)acetyl-CoA isomerase